MGIIGPDAYMHWRVTTDPIGTDPGVVTNIPFEQRVEEVTSYCADYWLLSTDGGKYSKYLAYTQTMAMQMVIRAHGYACPHVTCNVVTHE